nr:hypothetical protein [Candidatus Sigynarchaeota archaeon]
MAPDKLDYDAIQDLASSTNALTLLAQSIAPSICGRDNLKKAIGLLLFGGAKRIDEVNMNTDVYLQMIGDLATGKTEIIAHVSGLIDKIRCYSGGDIFLDNRERIDFYAAEGGIFIVDNLTSAPIPFKEHVGRMVKYRVSDFGIIISSVPKDYFWSKHRNIIDGLPFSM